MSAPVQDKCPQMILTSFTKANGLPRPRSEMLSAPLSIDPSKPMCIGIDCPFSGGGKVGGVAHVSIGLARGLSSLEGKDKYIFLVKDDFVPLIKSHIGGQCELVVLPELQKPTESYAKRLVRRVPFLRRSWRALRRNLPPPVPQSDGRVERLGVELVHFVSQFAFRTALPSIYHPHDLQHVHFPQYFTQEELRWRTFSYKYFCDQAKLVAVTSSWTAQDVHRQLKVPLEKISVVALAPPLLAYDSPSASLMDEIRLKTDDRCFIFYPAQTWPHKNHLNLIRALRKLRDRGICVPLVCSGYKNEYYRVVQAEVSRLGMADLVTFLGFVNDAEMQCLFNLCSFVVVPTKFEAESLPIWEAFATRRTVAASNVTSLPQQIGDGGLMFDPDDISQMSECIERLWRDKEARNLFAQRGFESVQYFTWERSARHFRALYRRLLGRTLTVEDQNILSAPPQI